MCLLYALVSSKGHLKGSDTDQIYDSPILLPKQELFTTHTT